jgi:hypothetical protein
MSTIWNSRKFWLMVADVTVSLATYFIGKYMNPAAAQDLLFLIGAIQPVVISVIVSITVQNLEGIKAEGAVRQALVYTETETPKP